MEKIKFPEFPWRSLIPLPNHTPSDFAERTTSHNKIRYSVILINTCYEYLRKSLPVTFFTFFLLASFINIRGFIGHDC